MLILVYIGWFVSIVSLFSDLVWYIYAGKPHHQYISPISSKVIPIYAVYKIVIFVRGLMSGKAFQVPTQKSKSK